MDSSEKNHLLNVLRCISKCIRLHNGWFAVVAVVVVVVVVVVVIIIIIALSLS